MTTLRARWEKQDYTGVIAEVPLGHVPHPKIFKPTAFLLNVLFRYSFCRCGSWLSFPENAICTMRKTNAPLTGSLYDGVGFLTTGLARLFWALFSPVSGTRQIPNLAQNFGESAPATHQHGGTVGKCFPSKMACSGFCHGIRVACSLGAGFNFHQAGIKRCSTADIGKSF